MYKKIKGQKKLLKQKMQFDDSMKPNEKIIELKRLYDFCLVYNVSIERVVMSLSPWRFVKTFNQSSLLTKEIYIFLNNEFAQDRIQHERVSGLKGHFQLPENEIDPFDIYKEKLKEIPKEPIQLDHLISENRFKEIKQKIKFDNTEIKSFFSDQEALEICERMSSSFTRRLCKEYFQFPIGKKKQECLFQLHYIANKAKEIYGGEILSFLLNLRKLNFKNITAKEVSTYKKDRPDFPFYRFEAEGIGIGFFLKGDHSNNLKPDVRIYSIDSNNLTTPIANVNHEGMILLKLESFYPKLSMFIEKTKMEQVQFFAGVETGNCIICYRELTHPLSLRTGIGPICARDSGIDRRLYNFNLQ